MLACPAGVNVDCVQWPVTFIVIPYGMWCSVALKWVSHEELIPFKTNKQKVQPLLSRSTDLLNPLAPQVCQNNNYSSTTTKLDEATLLKLPQHRKVYHPRKNLPKKANAKYTNNIVTYISSYWYNSWRITWDVSVLSKLPQFPESRRSDPVTVLLPASSDHLLNPRPSTSQQLYMVVTK